MSSISESMDIVAKAVVPASSVEIADGPEDQKASQAPSGLEHFGSAPWWFVSLSMHALLIALASLISMVITLPQGEDAVVMMTELQPTTKIAEQKKPENAESALESKLNQPATDPTSKETSDILVPPDILAKAELGDHFETINPEMPDTHSALGDPGAKMFNSIEGNIDAAGGGGAGGLGMEDLVGAGGGFGGGNGTGVGIGNGSGRGSFGLRTGGGRKLMVRKHGGSKATEGAVDSALEWLAYHQEADGHWDIKKYGGGLPTPQASDGGADEGITALAALAFLGAGHTTKVGGYRDNVRRAIDWLISKQRADGTFNSQRSSGYDQYDNALATLALSESYAMACDPKAGEAAQKGIDYIAKCQQPNGIWSHDCDSFSVSGWMIMALKSAKIAKLKVPEDAFRKAIKCIEGLSERGADGYWGKVGYNFQQRYLFFDGICTTAVGMVALQFMGMGAETTEQAEILTKYIPSWAPAGGVQNFYYWYYGTLGMFQAGGEPWKKWNVALKETLLPNQRKDGDEKGSWDPVTTFDPAGGRVYTTAMGALCLEVYYRYAQLASAK